MGTLNSFMSHYMDNCLGSLMLKWQAGKDKKWLKENMTAFKAKADEGDGDFQDILEEMRTRNDLNELL